MFFLEEIEWLKHDEAIMTVTYGMRRWLFFGPRARDRFIGSATVWRVLPSCSRCGTLTEGALCDLWQAARYRRDGVKLDVESVRKGPTDNG